MAILRMLVLGLLAWWVRQSIMPYLGVAADVVVVLPAFGWWVWRQPALAWWWLMSLSLLIDLFIVRGLPFYTLASLTAVAVYQLALEPYLSHATLVARLVALTAWLGLWRAAYLFWLGLGWLGNVAPSPLNQLSLLALLGWFGFGLGGWAGAVAVLNLARRISRAWGYRYG